MFSKIQVEYLFKNYVIFQGGGGKLIKRLHWITGGRWGGQGSQKRDYVIFEWSLSHKYVYLRLYQCLCVHVHVCVCVCMSLCVCVFECVFMYVFVCVRVCIWVIFRSRDKNLQEMRKLQFCNCCNFLSCKRNFLKSLMHIIWVCEGLNIKFQSKHLNIF